jgi:lipopolysaccharide/colanic/teichoic acid biosynthesis glycosyltransferase
MRQAHHEDQVDGGTTQSHAGAPSLHNAQQTRPEPLLLTHRTATRTVLRSPGYEQRVKPVLDFAGASFLCVVLSPLLAIVALAVYVRLGAPILVRQQRIGRDGKPFTMYKFRSMHHDRRRHDLGALRWEASERRVSHKRDDDPRLVQLGRFLRKWSLDELPQLLNIVRGDMSLVGPRPELATIVARYEPWQHARHEVKPGLTGWWQVTARNIGPMHEHTLEDLRYLKQISLRTDLKLLAMTLPAILFKMRGR